jgi:hypothetical protein
MPATALAVLIDVAIWEGNAIECWVIWRCTRRSRIRAPTIVSVACRNRSSDDSDGRRERPAVNVYRHSSKGHGRPATRGRHVEVSGAVICCEGVRGSCWIDTKLTRESVFRIYDRKEVRRITREP